ncbi:hypothetical protein KAH27_03285 [bacterium]|nr:hypothetical protein [bacterium]
MKAMSVRYIDERTFEKVKKAACETGLSVNKYVVELLENAVNKNSERFHDLDELLGSWEDEEFKLVSKAVKTQRKIDKELWK